MTQRIFRVFLRHSLPLLVATVVLGIGAIAISVRFTAGESESQAMVQLAQVRSYYEVVLQEMDALNLMFSTNPEMMGRIERLFNANALDYENYRDYKLIKSTFSAMIYSRSSIDSVYVYVPNRKQRVLSSENGIVPLSEMSDIGWYYSYFGYPGRGEFFAESAAIPVPGQEGRRRSILRIYRALLDSNGSTKSLIVMNLVADRLNFDDPLELSKRGRSLVVYDAADQELLAFGSPNLLTSSGAPSGVRYFSLRSGRFGWSYVMGIPKASLYALAFNIGGLTLLLAILICVLGLFLSYQTNRKERFFLQSVMDQLEAAGAAKVAVDPPRSDEDIFDYLRVRILRTFLEQDFNALQKEAMEYRALQMQINPHFLFNTLETINWRAVRLLSGSNDVSRMISLLAKLLKYSLEMRDSVGVPLSEEILFTGYYLDLQTIRFPDRFSVVWDVAPEAEAVRVPRLIFQPLLENSFAHGFRSDGGALRISIRAAVEHGFLKVAVSDDGKGMDAAAVAALEADSDEGGVGVANVRRRVRIFSKGRGRFLVASMEGAGTSVEIRIPT